MRPLEQSVRDTILQHDLVPEKSAILVAVSGGPDSTALLSILVNLVPDAVKAAIYIDHRLRPQETGPEIGHVKKLCSQFDIVFDYCSVDVQNVRMSSGESPEACARRLRFEALDTMAIVHKTNLLALGHNRDDQVEEVLIRLIRGSGANGLSGMSVRNKHIIRPLLNNSKQEILDYLAAAELPFCIDSSNKSRAYLRNKVRLDLIPLLEQEFNPSIKQTILNSALILRDEDSFLDGVTEDQYRTIITERQQSVTAHHELSCRIEAFENIPVPLRRRILEKMFWRFNSPPTFQAIEEIMRLVEQGRTGTTIHFSGGLRIIKTGDEVIFSSRPRDRKMRHRHVESFSEEISIERIGKYQVPQLGKILSISRCDQLRTHDDSVQYLDGQKATFPLVLRAFSPGERFQAIGAPGKKKISRFLSDRKIPRHLRHQFPVLVAQDHSIIAIPGLSVSDAAKVSEKTSTILKICWEQMG